LKPREYLYINHLEALVATYPEKFTNYLNILVWNPAAREKFLGALVGCVPTVTWEKCPNITLSILEKLSPEDRKELNTYLISLHIKSSWGDICNSRLIRWCYMALSENPTITWDIVQNYPGPWYYPALMRNPNITMDILASMPPEMLNHWSLSSNPNLKWDYVHNNPTRIWNYYSAIKICKPHWRDIAFADGYTEYVQRFAVLDIDYLRSRATLGEWEWSNISSNPSITLDMVLDNPELPWNYAKLTANRSITWEMIQITTLPWVLPEFSKNPNLRWDIVRDNPQIEWKWSSIAANSFRF